MTKRIMKAKEKLLVKKWPQIFDGMNRLGLNFMFLVILGYIYLASSEDIFIPFSVIRDQIFKHFCLKITF